MNMYITFDTARGDPKSRPPDKVNPQGPPPDREIILVAMAAGCTGNKTDQLWREGGMEEREGERKGGRREGGKEGQREGGEGREGREGRRGRKGRKSEMRRSPLSS